MLQVLCALCEPPTKLKYSGNTTNLFSHLSNKHPVTHNKLQRSSSSDSSLLKPGSSSQAGLAYFFKKQKKLPTDSKTAQNITKAVGYFIAKDMMPLNVVHGVGFCKMVEKLNPQYELPSRKIMTQKILPKMLGDLKDTEICPALQLADFCFLHDQVVSFILISCATCF